MDISAYLFFLGATITISVSGALQPGPVSAITIIKSRENRFAGILIAIGHGIIEFPLIILIGLGVLQLIENDISQILIGLIGGILLILMAWELSRTEFNPEIVNSDRLQQKFLTRNPFLAGIILSLVNPYFLLWWATIGAALIMTALPFGLAPFLLFALVHWSIDFFWLFFLGYTIHHTQKLFNSQLYQTIFWICSFLLVFFGLFFLYNSISLFYSKI